MRTGRRKDRHAKEKQTLLAAYANVPKNVTLINMILICTQAQTHTVYIHALVAVKKSEGCINSMLSQERAIIYI
jgi:hypothetical protein